VNLSLEAKLDQPKLMISYDESIFKHKIERMKEVESIDAWMHGSYEEWISVWSHINKVSLLYS